MKKSYVLLFCLLISVVYIFLPKILDFIIITFLGPVDDLSAARGQFGDMYGVITSLFSALTIVGLLYTINLQREELKMTKQSALDQREELELSRRQAEIQNEAIRFQRFENTFFKMIELQSLITNEVSSVFIATTPPTILTGKQAIKVLYGDLIFLLQIGQFNSDDPSQYNRLCDNYSGFYHRLEGTLDRYLLNIKAVSDLIMSTFGNASDTSAFYMSLLANQLDDNELVLFFYHSTLYKNTRYSRAEGGIALEFYANPLRLKHASHRGLLFIGE